MWSIGGVEKGGEEKGVVFGGKVLCSEEEERVRTGCEMRK